MLFSFLKIAVLSFFLNLHSDTLPKFSPPNDILKVVISQTTTDGELELIKSNLAYRNIVFRYATLRNKKSEMEHILFLVDCKDGYDGSYSLVFDKKNKTNKVGFIRNYTKQGKAFVIGDVEQYKNE